MNTYNYSYKDGQSILATGIVCQATYSLTTFPKCESILISHDSWVKEEFRGQGIGTKAHQSRLEVAEALGANYLICTVNAYNTPQIRILRKFGWKLLDSFIHNCTHHEVGIWGKRINSQGCS